MTSFRNIVPRRAHKERAQPSRRVARHGLLEKKRDYKLRAADSSRKRRRAALLREKASFRNPDEFYHAMISAKPTARGVNVRTRDPNAPNHHVADGDVRRLVESQDRAYVRMKRARERVRIDGAKKSLHFLDAAAADKRRRHVVYVGKDDFDDGDDSNDSGDSCKAVRATSNLSSLGSVSAEARDEAHKLTRGHRALSDFDPEAHFEKERLRVLRSVNGDDFEDDLAFAEADAPPTPPRTNRTERKRDRKSVKKAYRELDQREQRASRLDTAMEDLALRQKLLGKGARRKVSAGDPKAGILPVFKWRKQRSK